MTIAIWLVVVVALGVLFLALRGLVGAYLKFRGARVITCPENQQPAAVAVDAPHAALTSLAREPRLRLQDCSRWPEMRDCGQECLSQIEDSPEGCLVRRILTDWYEGKTCVLCGQELGRINWAEHKPALMSPEGHTTEWRGVAPERVPAVLATHRPVCWNCHVATTFRQDHPELVVDRPWKGSIVRPK